MNANCLSTRLTLPLALLALLAAVSAQAQGTMTFIDFETFPGGSPVPGWTEITTQYVSLGVIFDSIPVPGATQRTMIVDYSPSVSGKNHLDPNGSRGGPPFILGGTLILTFPAPVSSVGSFFIDDQKPVRVTAFDASANTVGRATSDGKNVGFDSWQLTYALGISRVEMAGGYFLNGPDGWGIDDLGFSVLPEPASISILLLGLLPLLAHRRSIRPQ